MCIRGNRILDTNSNLEGLREHIFELCKVSFSIEQPKVCCVVPIGLWQPIDRHYLLW